METPNSATPNNINIDSILATSSAEALLGLVKELVIEIHGAGMRAWEKLNTLKKIWETVGNKKISEKIKEIGYKFTELKKCFFCLEAKAHVDEVTFANATVLQLQQVGKINSKELLAYIPKQATMLELGEAIKQYRKGEKAKLPPKEPKQAMRWEYKIGIGRVAVFEFQDIEVARTAMHLWEEAKGTTTPQDALRQAFILSGDKTEPPVEVEVPQPETANPIEEVPIAAEPDEPVEVPEPPKTTKRIPTPDAWKKGWEPGTRCLPIWKSTYAAKKLYEWTNGEFPVIDSVVGDVGTVQFISLVRADGQRYETYGNWIMEAPTSNEDITCEVYLRKCRLSYQSLLDAKATKDDEGIMTYRLEYEFYKEKLRAWCQEHCEYLEYFYTEINKIEAQHVLELNSSPA